MGCWSAGATTPPDICGDLNLWPVSLCPCFKNLECETNQGCPCIREAPFRSCFVSFLPDIFLLATVKLDLDENDRLKGKGGTAEGPAVVFG